MIVFLYPLYLLFIIIVWDRLNNPTTIIYSHTDAIMYPMCTGIKI